MTGFARTGWAIFPPEPATAEWAEHARRDAVRAVAAPDLGHWFQCERTWFVGLDVLNNDAVGRVGDSAPLAGNAVDFIRANCGGWPSLHRAQISVVYPGYPKPREGESAAAFRYRRDRDAAHVDGVIGVGMPKRRFVREPHAFILGIPLTQADPGAAPLVVWEGSHEIMRNAFARAFSGHAKTSLSELDVTDVYVSVRKKVFETCRRVVLHGPPGSTYVIHRLALHGVAPWAENASADPVGRMIAYLRPTLQGGPADWIALA